LPKTFTEAGREKTPCPWVAANVAAEREAMEVFFVIFSAAKNAERRVP
jgi:hypothetical protein